MPRGNKDMLPNYKIPVPPMDIQEKVIAECEKVDDEYNTSRMTIEECRTQITKLFADLKVIMSNNYSDWYKLCDLLVPINGSKIKIAEDDILETGLFPVITQENDKLISGYTNIQELITDLPIIVFGDHTCVFKYVNFPFVRGADGTQLIKTDETKILMRFLCGYLQTQKIENSEKYERHFKYLKQMIIPILPLEEQKRIVAEVETYEAEITKAKTIMDSAPVRKQEILRKYRVMG